MTIAGWYTKMVDPIGAPVRDSRPSPLRRPRRPRPPAPLASLCSTPRDASRNPARAQGAVPDLVGRHARRGGFCSSSSKTRAAPPRGPSASPSTRPNYTPETIDTAWLAIREWLAPRLIGRDVAHPSRRARHPRARHPRPQHGQGRARDGVLGTRRRARARRRCRRCSAARVTVCRPASRSASSRRRSCLVERAVDAVAAGYRKIKLKIQPGQDVDVRRRGARGARPRRRAHGRRERRVHDRRRGASRGARRVRPDDARAAARRRRVAATRRAAAADEDADLPRRVDHRRHARARHDRARQRAHHQHQAGTRRRVRGVDRDPRRVPRRRRSGLVRRHARERHRPRVQRGARVAAELLAARRSESERALLGARHRVARMDDGRERHGRRAARPRRDSASTSTSR